MELLADIVEVDSLSTQQKERMFELLDSYFQNTQRQAFETDLGEKQWVVLISEVGTMRIQGFSTLRMLEDEVEGTPVRAFFSGDTIIHKAFRGKLALQRVWLRFTFQHAMRNPGFRYFWFLIVNSYRSFRYLPIYAKKYYPNPASEIPDFERKVLTQLAVKRYGDAYDIAAGVVRLPRRSPLRRGVADIGKNELQNPQIAFFKKCNPEWREGTALACIAEFSIENIHRYGLRIVEETLGSRDVERSPALQAAHPSA
jgi:hypothetical protein